MMSFGVTVLFLSFIFKSHRPAFYDHVIIFGRKRSSSSGGGPLFLKIAFRPIDFVVVGYRYRSFMEQRRAALNLKHAARRLILTIPRNFTNTRMFIWFSARRSVPCGYPSVIIVHLMHRDRILRAGIRSHLPQAFLIKGAQ